MSLKIDPSQLADIANDHDIEGREEAIAALEEAATRLADLVSEHFGIQNDPAILDPMEFGGLMVAFSPAFEGQDCPDPISEADPHGDWE